MPKVYEHPEGGLIADLKEKLDVLVQTRVEPGNIPANQIATDSVFNLAGQGTTPQKARDSLAGVLTAHLAHYRKNNALKELCSSPWKETEWPEEAIPGLQEAFRRRFRHAIQFVVSKS